MAYLESDAGESIVASYNSPVPRSSLGQEWDNNADSEGKNKKHEREREVTAREERKKMGKAEVLLSLHGRAAHSGQIEAWQADLKAFDELKADDEDELRRVRGEAYQMATWYAAFQAVIFTAVSQASLLSCKLWWCPVSLSVAVSVATFLAIAEKLYSMGEIKEDIKEVGLNIAALMQCLDLVEEKGADMDLETAQPLQGHHRHKLAGYKYIVSREGLTALLCVACFSLLIAAFSTKSLCSHCSVCVL